MNPRLGWLATIAVAAATLTPLARAAERTNVLMIAVDDMRPQLGCYGDPTVLSPNIDRLAQRGLVFDRAYCQQALCSPSRISLLSSRRPPTSGIYQIGPTLRSKLPDVITLPQHFKQNGYTTRSLGKVFHVGIDDPPSWSEPSWQSKKPRYGPEGTAAVAAYRRAMAEAKKEIPQKGEGGANYAGPAFEHPDVADEDLSDGDIAREALEVMRSLAQDEKPFFLAVGFHNPHVPWVAPQKYWDLYDTEKMILPPNNFVPRDAPPFAATSGDDFYWYGNSPKNRVVSPDFGRECLHGYLAAISYIDAQVGRLLGELDRLGLAENTIVILWGDHGYYMGEHSWWGGKHNNYEGATRVAMIIATPEGRGAGKHTSALVEFVDIYPTLSELAGLPTPVGVEGTSYVPLLDQPDRPWKRAAFSHYPKGGNLGTSMRTDRYRYVEWIDREGKLVARELYDHQTDPEENQNLADRADQAQVLDQLARQFQAGWKGAVPTP